MGVSHSQDRVSRMYSKGEGTKLSLTEAYGWSVLAAQRGASEMKINRDGLLEQVSDKKKAEKKAEKKKLAEQKRQKEIAIKKKKEAEKKAKEKKVREKKAIEKKA